MKNKEVIIYRKAKGQIVVHGNVRLTDEQGKDIEHREKFTLFGCSKSKNLPFCDGSHKIDF